MIGGGNLPLITLSVFSNSQEEGGGTGRVARLRERTVLSQGVGQRFSTEGSRGSRGKTLGS